MLAGAPAVYTRLTRSGISTRRPAESVTARRAASLGEFGATLMLAGNIPGKTTTVPLAIYTAVQTGEMGEAVVLVLALTVLSCLVLVLAGRLGARAA